MPTQRKTHKLLRSLCGDTCPSKGLETRQLVGSRAWIVSVSPHRDKTAILSSKEEP